jgi:hypothetical protein
MELETYTDLSTLSSAGNFAESVINGVSEYITVSVQYSGVLKEYEFTLAGGTGSGMYSRAGSESSDKLVFRSKYFDSDLNNCTVTISDTDTFGYFSVTVKDGDTLVESFSNLLMEEGSDRYVETIINKSSTRIVCTVNTNPDVTLEEDVLTFSGGDNGISGISDTDIIGEETGSGLNSFSNEETVSIDLLLAPGWSDASVINAGLSICESRGDCMYIADTPFGLSAQEVTDWANGTGTYTHQGFDSSYGAVYWPWVLVSDSYTKKNMWLPNSGYVAAQYAYTESNGHPWLAPAGLNRGLLTRPIGVETSPTKGERDAVYQGRNIVNPIANVLGSGLVIWGQKTMQRAPSSLDRVNVRRLMNYLKKSIGESTKYFVFEQNVSSTWDKWSNMVEPVLSNIKNNEGIYDYKISISPTANDIENSRMPAVIAIKPTKTAEYIPLEFQIASYSASFD